MGEKEHEPFQFTFNGFLKGDFLGSRVTSDAGLVLVRELDERLGLAKFIAEHMKGRLVGDARHWLNHASLRRAGFTVVVLGVGEG